MSSYKNLGFYLIITTVLTLSVGFSTEPADVRKLSDNIEEVKMVEVPELEVSPKATALLEDTQTKDLDKPVLVSQAVKPESEEKEVKEEKKEEDKEVPVVESRTFYQVTSAFLNVRKQSDKDSKIVDVLVKDWIVETKEAKKNDWVELKDGGFVNTKYLKQLKDDGEKLFVEQKEKKKPVPTFEQPKPKKVVKVVQKNVQKKEQPKATQTISNDKSEVVVETASTGNINTSKNETQVTSTSGFSEYEVDLLARLVRAEAQGESYEGKVAVAIVVLNRIDSGKFPSTMEGVIYQAGQFSPVSNGSINQAADSESRRAAQEAINSQSTLNGSLYFYNPQTAQSRWLDGLETTATIGSHVFKR